MQQCWRSYTRDKYRRCRAQGVGRAPIFRLLAAAVPDCSAVGSFHPHGLGFGARGRRQPVMRPVCCSLIGRRVRVTRGRPPGVSRWKFSWTKLASAETRAARMGAHRLGSATCSTEAPHVSPLARCGAGLGAPPNVLEAGPTCTRRWVLPVGHASTASALAAQSLKTPRSSDFQHRTLQRQCNEQPQALEQRRLYHYRAWGRSKQRVLLHASPVARRAMHK